jgi:hypothetical protein
MSKPKRGKVIKARLVKLEFKGGPEPDTPEHRIRKEAFQANKKRMDNESPSAAATGDAELMRLWGEINSYWDDIEYWLFFAFDAMLADDWRMTRAIFYSQRSHAARRDMVQELAKQFFAANDAGFKPLKNAIQRIKARADTRHNLTHGTWGWLHSANFDGPTPTLEIVRMSIDPDSIGQSRRYTKKDIKNELFSMKDTWRTLAEAVLPLMRKKAEASPDASDMKRFLMIEQSFSRKTQTT